MIAPVPHLPLPPGAATSAEPPVAGQDIDNFAQLLATSAVAAPPMPGPALLPDRGPATMPEGLALAESNLPTDREVPIAERPSAQAFNEDGLLPVYAIGEASEREILARPPGVAERFTATSSPFPLPVGERLSAAPFGGQAALSAAAAPVAGTRPEPSLRAVRALRTSQPIARQNIPAAEEAEGIEPPSAVRRDPVRRAETRAALHVAIAEVEQGIQVAARTGALDQQERQRLQDRIAGLLSSHGLSPRAIRIIAPVGGARSSEGNR